MPVPCRGRQVRHYHGRPCNFLSWYALFTQSFALSASRPFEHWAAQASLVWASLLTTAAAVNAVGTAAAARVECSRPMRVPAKPFSLRYMASGPRRVLPGATRYRRVSSPPPFARAFS